MRRLWRLPSVACPGVSTHCPPSHRPCKMSCTMSARRAGVIWNDLRVGYREFRPPPELEPVVRCLWVRHSVADETVDVLPDGCVDIVVRDGRASVAGPDTRAAPTRATAGQTIVGARFHPGAAAAALGVPASELRDARVPLEAIWGRFAVELAERGSGGPGDLAAVLAERTGADADRLVLASAAALERNPDTTVRDL